MKIMRKLFYIVLVLSITNCAVDYDYDYNIKELAHKELTYDELPKNVSTAFLAASIGETKKDRLLFGDIKDSSVYHLEEVEIKNGPWIAYFRLIDMNKQIKYRIDYSQPFPYIVNNNMLYIPNKADIFYSDRKIKLLKYMEYKLK